MHAYTVMVIYTTSKEAFCYVKRIAIFVRQSIDFKTSNCITFSPVTLRQLVDGDPITDPSAWRVPNVHQFFQVDRWSTLLCAEPSS